MDATRDETAMFVYKTFDKGRDKTQDSVTGSYMANEPRFDIFSGATDKDTMWMESVEGLANARKRMEEIAAQVPGKYFVFSTGSHSILAQIDTTKDILRAGDSSAKKQTA